MRRGGDRRGSRVWRLGGVVLGLVLLPAAAASAAPPAEVAASLRLRGETFDTPSGDPALDRDYTLLGVRARLAVDAAPGRWRLHAVLQGAATSGLPERGAFGIGPVYFAASGGDSTPSQAAVAEASVGWQGDRFEATVGRQGWRDGQEILTGVANLDAVKRRRLAERLVGNWDWVNVGRRYDGASFGLRLAEAVHVAAFGFRPLAGGVDYDDAFEPLDDLRVFGLTVTGRYGAWLPASEVRLWGIRYDDERPGALAAAGGPIELDTAGVSVLAGGEGGDLLVWLAWQRGDWGRADHDAVAWIVEGGRRFQCGERSLYLRGGGAQASGDDTPGGRDHGTFFNLLPTNHKFYGAMDYSAFQNLRDLYTELLVAGAGPWSLRLALHRFEIVERGDAWYGGSGAFDAARLGYAGRRPPGGRFSDRHLGDEIDLSAARKLPHGLSLDAGVSAFFAGSGGEEVLTAEGDGTWAYLQVSWSR